MATPTVPSVSSLTGDTTDGQMQPDVLFVEERYVVACVWGKVAV